MDQDLYDEFGNYIGPDIADEDDEGSEEGEGQGGWQREPSEDEAPMEIEGLSIICYLALNFLQRKITKPHSSYKKTRNTILMPKKSFQKQK